MASKRTDPYHALREDLVGLLKGGHAHLDFDSAVADLPSRLYGAKVEHQPHTPWRLIEHIRIAQWDILEFVRNPKHQSPPWPEGYWPKEDAPKDSSAWTRSVQSYRTDLTDLQELVADPANDLLAPLPHGQGQTLAREAMLAADHTAYHLGQLVTLRRALGAWKEP